MVTNIVIIAAVVLFLGVYVSWRAGRLDRMHTRLEAAHAALDVTLVRRSSVALELASSGLLDPATSLLLAEAAHEARGGAQSALAQGELAHHERAQRNGAQGELAHHELAHHERTQRNGAQSELARNELVQGNGAQSELARNELVQRNGAQSELAQSNLSRALRAAFAQPGFRTSLTGKDGADELLAEVEAAAQQVFVARTFYNNAVAVTQEARSKPLVRLLRLAGKAERPEFFEMDDSLAAEGGDGAGADMQRLAG